MTQSEWELTWLLRNNRTSDAELLTTVRSLRSVCRLGHLQMTSSEAELVAGSSVYSSFQSMVRLDKAASLEVLYQHLMHKLVLGQCLHHVHPLLPQLLQGACHRYLLQ